MLKIGGCRRCGGDLAIEYDVYGWYEECVQCGYTHDIPAKQALVPVRVTRSTTDSLQLFRRKDDY